MKKRGAVLTIGLFLVLAQITPVSASGSDITIKWWRDLRNKVAQYGVTLNDLYHRVNRDSKQFCQILVTKYPNSVCEPGSMFGGLSGRWAVDESTDMNFDENWQITSMVTTTNGVKRTYHFKTDGTGDFGMVDMTTDTRRVVFRFFGQPEKPIFTMAHIPEMTGRASEVATLREPPFKNRNVILVGILNDVYMGRLAEAGYPMDQMAEQILTDLDFQDTVINEAQGLYAGAN